MVTVLQKIKPLVGRRPQLAASNFDDLLRLNDCTIFLLLASTLTICDGDRVLIECPTYHTIDVSKIFYGRLDRTTCPKEGYMRDTSCILIHAIAMVRLRCQNNRTCSVQPPGDFGLRREPCPRTHKYLTLTYSCISK